MPGSSPTSLSPRLANAGPKLEAGTLVLVQPGRLRLRSLPIEATRRER